MRWGGGGLLMGALDISVIQCSRSRLSISLSVSLSKASQSDWPPFQLTGSDMQIKGGKAQHQQFSGSEAVKGRM